MADYPPLTPIQQQTVDTELKSLEKELDSFAPDSPEAKRIKKSHSKWQAIDQRRKRFPRDIDVRTDLQKQQDAKLSRERPKQ
jgi:cell fate (sporulation/competence/biofilm development) regulator YlbF (YheA/YmcA/DUF963 family)